MPRKFPFLAGFSSVSLETPRLLFRIRLIPQDQRLRQAHQHQGDKEQQRRSALPHQFLPPHAKHRVKDEKNKHNRLRHRIRIKMYSVAKCLLAFIKS